MDKPTIQVGSKKIEIWPEGQSSAVKVDPTIRVTRFDDIDDYHPGLIAQILAMERQGKGKQYRRGGRGLGGTKIHHIERWGFAEAELINARAMTLFKTVLDFDEAVTDLSWATISRSGEYCMPHSHLRSTASSVYFLQPGDVDLDDPYDGRFFFADPRLKACCGLEEGHLTTPYVPASPPGMMIIFPSAVIHCVNPYTGKTPRVTMSWNINRFPVAGSPFSLESVNKSARG